MADTATTEAPPAEPAGLLHVAPAPHVSSRRLTTRRMMLDVLIGLVPVIVASVWVFRGYAVRQMVICVASAVVAEVIFTGMRRRPISIGDFSAAVTGLILAFSLPPTAPWYVDVIGAFVAIGIGKAVFGGLGQNIFNPAMVGRAFVMVCFASLMGASAYVDPHSTVDVMTQATPLTAARQMAPNAGPQWSLLLPLLLGNTNGSLGETSALACLIGGLYLCLRRTSSWEIPAGVLLAVAVIGGLGDLIHPNHPFTVLHHLLGGALMLGAFFIATDPVTSPLTSRGKFIFGAGVGALVMLMRAWSGYPEGVMFSVLLMNSIVPLINRGTIPRPVGGPVPAKKA
jgi:electron transport complex protein RnfD